MPNEARRDVWQFWKEVSKIVKTTTRPRPTKAKWKVQQIPKNSEPRIEVIKENEELELSIMHLEEHAERQEADDRDDANLPVVFTQDLNTPVADKEHSYGYTPDLQLLYSSVYTPETANTLVYSSEANSTSGDTNVIVYSSETASTGVYSTEVNSIPVSSSEAASTAVYSSDVISTDVVCSYEAATITIDSSQTTHAPEVIVESRDSSSFLETVDDTCEIYTTDGSNAILVSSKMHVQDAQEINQQKPKRRRGRPRKVQTNDASKSCIVKSISDSTDVEISPSRPRRIKKAKESSIYCYIDDTNRRKDNNFESDLSDHNSDGQENSEHLFDDNQVEMGDKENEAGDGISPNGKRKRLKSGSYELGPVNCPECGVQLAYSSSLAAHMRKHSGARPFKCSTCNKGFTTKANMLRHELTHSGTRPFPCPTCDKSFTEAKSLEVHIRTHTGEKPYVCTICNASFRQRGTLQAHIYCHTGHKGHLCDVCGKAFRQKTQLREHQKRHTNNRTVKCDVCEKMFYGKGELYRHSLQHSGDRPYKCSLCQKTFTRLQYLREHTNIHTGKKPHVCGECSAAFHDMASLYRHHNKHKQQRKKANDVDTVDIKKELFESEVVIVNNNATDEDLQELIAEASENGQIQVSQTTDNQLQAAAQSIIDAALPVAQVYQITYVDEENDLGRTSRSDNGQMLPTVDFSAINLLANATQLSIGQ